MAFKIACPNCQQPMQVGADQAGKQMRCVKCQKAFQVPSIQQHKAPEPIVVDEILTDVGAVDEVENIEALEEVKPASRQRPAPAAKSSGGGCLIGLVVAAVLGLVVLLVGGGAVAAIVFLFMKPSAEKVAGGNPLPKIDDKKIDGKKGDDKKDDPKKDDVPPKDEVKIEQVLKAALEKGQYRSQGTLEPDDCKDPLTNNQRKLYTIDLQAGRKYTIDLVSTDFDAFLRLEDSSGAQVAKDDDSGGDLNARIIYVASQPGTFRISATTFNGKTGNFTLTVREEVATVTEQVGGPKSTRDGLTITQIKLPGDFIMPDLIWTPEGDAFFVLTFDGYLRRVTLNDFVATKVKLFNHAVSLALSREGLVAAMNDVRQLWVIDPVSLAVKKKIDFPDTTSVVSSPALDIALAITPTGVTVVDLVGGQTFGPLNKVAKSQARVSPDGKYYFARGGDQLCSYKIEGTTLVEFQKSGHIAQSSESLTVSPDSKFVALPALNGNNQAPDFPTFIYKVDDLSKPAFAIAGGAFPRLVGFDPIGGTVFTQRQSKQLLVFTMNGTKVKEYDLTANPTDAPRQFVTHPQGKKLLALLGKDLVYVQMPDLVASVDPKLKDKPPVDPKEDPKNPVKEDPKTPVEMKFPAPTAPALALAQKMVPRNGLAITPLNLAGDKVVGDLIWTPGGDAFFALTREGVLSRIGAKGLIEEKRLEIGQPCTFLAMSGAGLLATSADPPEVWVIDPGTLEIKKRFPAPGAQRVLSAPALKIGFGIGKDGVTILDLVKGAAGESLKKVPTLLARLSPDGKYYFAQNGFEQLASYVVEDGTLVKNQVSERIAQNGQSICVSPDSKYVCLPSREGNHGLDFGTFVYPVDNLQQAAFTLMSGAFPRLVGFDPVAGTVFAQNVDSQLVFYSMAGKKLREYTLTDNVAADQPTQFVTHPQGKKLLVQAGKSVLLVEVGELVAANPKDVGKGLADLKLPAPTTPGKSLGLPKTDNNGLAVTPLTLPADKVVGDIVWTPAGDAFFTLTSDGVLSRIALKGFVEEGRIELGQPCSYLSYSGEGLLVTLTRPQEVWIIDPATLEVKNRMAVPGAQRVVSAPPLKVAYAAGAETLSILDLVKCETVSQLKKMATLHPRVSPDGKYYFGQGGIEELCSYKIEGQNLVPFQTSARIATNGQGVAISPDSKFVCLTAAGGNGGGTQYSTSIFKIDDLKTAAATIPSGAYPKVVAFDAAAGVVYAQNREKQLMIFAPNGTLLKEYTLLPRGEPRQFVPHPEGKKLLVLIEKTLLYVELGEMVASVPKESPKTPVDAKVPTPTAPGTALGDNKTKGNGLTMTAVSLPADKIVGDLHWTADGTAFFALTKDGNLSRVLLKGLIEEKRLTLGQSCSSLAVSAEGLLVTLSDLQEVWVVDPVSLDVKKRIVAPQILRAVSAPTLKVALATTKEGVLVLDLAMGKAGPLQKGVPTKFASVTPDGDYYFAQSAVEELCSYKIDGTKLIEHQKTKRIAQNGQAICISPDSRYVCLPSASGNYGTTYGTYIYKVGNLKKEVLTLTTGPYPQALGFDPEAGLIFAQKAGKQFMLFTMAGAKMKEFSLAAERGITDQPRQFAVHPAGKRLLILAGKHLLYVELDIAGIGVGLESVASTAQRLHSIAQGRDCSERRVASRSDAMRVAAGFNPRRSLNAV